jgi:hypothetical protein
MEIQYCCNSVDYGEVLLTSRTRSLNKKVVRAILSAALFAFLTMLLVNLGFRQGTAAALIIVLLPFLFIAYRYIAFPFWSKRDFVRHPNFSREQRLKIDEEGLHHKSEVGSSDTKWMAYTTFLETENLFVLYLGERLAECIPKRALSGIQLEELRQLLRRKVT